MLPMSLTSDDGPIYVNAKQYHGIIRRRQIRAKAMMENKLARTRKVCKTYSGPPHRFDRHIIFFLLVLEFIEDVCTSKDVNSFLVVYFLTGITRTRSQSDADACLKSNSHSVLLEFLFANLWAIRIFDINIWLEYDILVSIMLIMYSEQTVLLLPQ